MKNEFLSSYAKKRSENDSLANLFDLLYKKYDFTYYANKAYQLRSCGSFLEFAENITDQDDKILVNANFCRFRLCPQCTWRRSLKVFSQMMRYISVLQDKDKLKSLGLSDYCKYFFRYVFVTLTVKNVSGSDLSNAIDKMYYAYSHGIMRWKRVKSAVLGHYKALEVTYNKENDTYHPHIHAIWVVPSSYFSNDTYISQNELRDLWVKACNLDYEPQVHIEAVKPMDGFDKDAFASAVCEVTKYTVTPDDMLQGFKNLEQQLKMIKTLDLSLRNRRLFSYAGLFKEVNLALGDLDPMVSDLTDFERLKKDSTYIIRSYAWNVGYMQYDYMFRFTKSLDLFEKEKEYRNISKHLLSMKYINPNKEFVTDFKENLINLEREIKDIMLEDGFSIE